MNQMTTFGGMQVLPAGATSRQELRYLLEEAKRSGRPYIEAPRTYTRGGREEDRYGRTKDLTGFYDEQGMRFSGTFLGGGSYGGHGAGNAPSDTRSDTSAPSSGYLPIPAPRQLSSQERANINEVDAREARRQRIRNATRRASIFPYLQPKPAYDLGESGNSPSMFSNYPIYGPNYL